LAARPVLFPVTRNSSHRPVQRVTPTPWQHARFTDRQELAAFRAAELAAWLSTGGDCLR
jgi:hypothetical protein